MNIAVGGRRPLDGTRYGAMNIFLYTLSSLVNLLQIFNHNCVDVCELAYIITWAWAPHWPTEMYCTLGANMR